MRTEIRKPEGEVRMRYLGTQAPETTLKPATLRRGKMSDGSET